jgi:hypothetical protein
VGKLVLSLAYLLFFSVQTCFRYTASPADLEAVNWAQTQDAQVQAQDAQAQVQTQDAQMQASQAKTPGQQIVHAAVKSGAFSYLNKRYEQNSMPYLPAHPGQISPVSFLVAHQYFYQNDNQVSRIHNPALLRGPPALQS